LRQIEKLLKFDEDTGEWYIEGMDEYMHHIQKYNIEDNDKHLLAMGFEDDEERKNTI
jgi:hypothetical protein